MGQVIEIYFNNRINNLQEELSEIEVKLSTMPEGELVIYSNREKYCRYYVMKNSGKSYISKREIEKASLYANKKYLELKKNLLIDQIEAIKYYQEYIFQSSAALNDFLLNKQFSNILINSNSSISNKHITWITSNFPTNQNHQESLTPPVVQEIWFVPNLKSL